MPRKTITRPTAVMAKNDSGPLDLADMIDRDSGLATSAITRAVLDRHALLAEVNRLRTEVERLQAHALPVDHSCDHEWRCTQCGGFWEVLA